MPTISFSGAIFGALLSLAAVPCLAQQSTPPAPAGAFFSVDGDNIYYTTAGTGTPILLIHGFPLDRGLFKFQQSAFSTSYQVITVDLPGFGSSTTATAQQTEVHYASEMLALLQHLGISSAVIGGHSMGGQVVLEMYRQAPAVFRGMILFDTNPAAANTVEKAEWPAYGQAAEMMGSASIAPSIAPVMVTGDAIAQHPQFGDYVMQMVSVAKPNGVAGGGNALANRSDYTAMLGSISVPTLVVVGQDDTVYPVPISRALAAGIPGATLAVIPGAAHGPMFQSFGTVNPIMQSFLSRMP